MDTHSGFFFRLLVLSGIVLIALSLCCCSNPGEADLVIVSGSENETLEPLVKAYAKQEGIRIDMVYKGSVDMMLEMGNPEFPYDAVWPANSLWITLGDSLHRIRHVESIMKSPVVFGIRKSLAERMGFTSGDIRVRDILDAIEDNRFSFMMTSATQSNSGASAYIGFLYALLGNPGVITLEDLHNDELKQDIRSLLSGINRSSGSSGWLKELFIHSDYDAMVNYEALIIESNQELERMGKETLHVVYPVDGIVMADSPLGYVDKGDKRKEATFQKLQKYLLSDEVQQLLLDAGRRTGFAGIAGKTDPEVFNPEWGIEPDRLFSPIKMPSAEVLSEALRLYQSEFRKPSYTVFALDFSGSMQGKGESQMKEAMAFLLDPDRSGEYMVQSGKDDVIVVVPFSHQVLDGWMLKGVTDEGLEELRQKIEAFAPDGGTDIYSPAIFALELMQKEENLGSYIPAVVLLTDGEHTEESSSFHSFEQAYRNAGLDIPVFSILFGQAVEEELKEISRVSKARVFDGRKDLIHAFRSVKGYN